MAKVYKGFNLDSWLPWTVHTISLLLLPPNLSSKQPNGETGKWASPYSNMAWDQSLSPALTNSKGDYRADGVGDSNLLLLSLHEKVRGKNSYDLS